MRKAYFQKHLFPTKEEVFFCFFNDWQRPQNNQTSAPVYALIGLPGQAGMAQVWSQNTWQDGPNGHAAIRAKKSAWACAPWWLERTAIVFFRVMFWINTVLFEILLVSCYILPCFMLTNRKGEKKNWKTLELKNTFCIEKAISTNYHLVIKSLDQWNAFLCRVSAYTVHSAFVFHWYAVVGVLRCANGNAPLFLWCFPVTPEGTAKWQIIAIYSMPAL